MSGRRRSRTTRSAVCPRTMSSAVQVIGGGRDDIALALQARLQKAKNWRFIIDDKNPKRTRCWRHGRASVASLFLTGIGSLMVKTAPDRSIRLAAVIEPPMASTKPRQIARPSPVPARCRSERRIR